MKSIRFEPGRGIDSRPEMLAVDPGAPDGVSRRLLLIRASAAGGKGHARRPGPGMRSR